MLVKIFFDGACNNHLEHPHAGVGIAVFFCDEDGEHYNEELSRAIAILPNELGIRNTNNTTEWQACIEAMRTYLGIRLHMPTVEMKVYSDSQVVTQVFNGRYQTHTPEFKKYNKQAHEATRGYDVTIEWVPRKLNQQADKLSKEGLQLASELLVGTLDNESSKSTRAIFEGCSLDL